MSDKIFSGKIKYVLVIPGGTLIGLRVKPKKIAGGYMTNAGRRYITDPERPFNTIKCVLN